MKNTEYEVKAVDTIAFFETLTEKFYNKVSIDYVNKNKQLKMIYSRYSMDQNGYHNGYEQYHIKWDIIKKDLLGIFGIPTSIFDTVIIPLNFEISKIVGAERQWKNYYKPDEDFVYQEIEYFLKNEVLPDLLEAEFKTTKVSDGELRVWSIGYCDFPI